MTKPEQAELIQAQMQSIRSRLARDTVSLQFHAKQFQQLRKHWMRRAMNWTIGTAAVGVGLVGFRWAVSRKSSSFIAGSTSSAHYPDTNTPIGLPAKLDQLLPSASHRYQAATYESSKSGAIKSWLTAKAIQSLGSWVLPIVMRHATALLSKREDQHERRQ